MKRLDIQGLRAVAVLLVVAFHAGLPVPGGFVGVDVFFAISGFVIAATLLRELDTTGRVRLSRFYSRRVKRLGPALALVIAIVALLGIVASPVETQRLGATTGLFAALFSANAFLITVPAGYFDPSASLNPFLHLWTLGVEEQFYLVFPGVLLLAWLFAVRLGRPSRQVVGLTVALSAAGSFALAIHFAESGAPSDQRLAFYGAPTRAWEFALGVLLAVVAPLVGRMPRALAGPLSFGGLGAIGVAAFWTGHNDGYPVTATLVPVLGTCAVIAAGIVHQETSAARLISTRPAVWLGDLSYSWYLWHWPLIVYASVVWPAASWTSLAPAIAALVPAWLSFRYVENPIRFNPHLKGRSVLALSVACVIVPLGACLGFRAISDGLANTPEMKAYARSQDDHLDVSAGCQSTPLDDQAPDCTWGATDRPRRVVLLGDSNASQFSEPVARAARRADLQAKIVTKPYCPFLDVTVLRDKRDWEARDCRTFYERNMRTLIATKPTLVIVAARTDEYLKSRAFRMDDPDGGGFTNTRAAKERLWYQGLRATVNELNDNDIPVVIVHPVPALRYSVNDCAVIRILTRSCANSVNRSAANARLRDAIDIEDNAAAPNPTSTTLDTQPDLCDLTRCRGIEDGELLYRDSTHLSVAAAARLTETFYSAIVDNARRDPYDG